MDVKTAIQAGDADALRCLLREDISRANALIHWGGVLTHPLHYVSDMLFDGTLKRGIPNGWSPSKYARMKRC